MKALKDCSYTAFISYAHADDEAWFNWITQFRDELARSLQALLRGVPLPPFHLSGENGPVAGRLSDELKERVAASFATIIVVHDNYAQSTWCLKELEYFKSLFGDEGFRERLYIVAMSEAAMLRVAGSEAWKRLLPTDDQLWIPFFDHLDRTRPLDVYLSPGFVAPAFRQPFERLRAELAASLKKSWQTPASPVSAPPPTTPARPVGVPPAAPAAPAPAALLMGFVPPATAPAAAAAAQALSAQGLPVRALGLEAMATDFAEFAAATDLVLPFDDAPLMMTTVLPGGHLEMQRNAWLQKGRPESHLHMLDLRDGPDALQGLVAKLRPAATAEPAAAPQGVRIYIESNRHERTLWEPLGDQIRRKWDELCVSLAPARMPPLTLRAHGLPVDDIDRFPMLDDADGVVLLWGRKTSDALVAQINKIERKTSPGRDAAPGIVAYLMPPQQATEPVPAWGWQVLRFDARDEDAIDVLDDERDQLKRFLKKVFERRRQREARGLA